MSKLTQTDQRKDWGKILGWVMIILFTVAILLWIFWEVT